MCGACMSRPTPELCGMLRYRFHAFAMVVGIGFLLFASLVISALLAAAGKSVEQCVAGARVVPAGSWISHVSLLIITVHVRAHL